MRFITWLLRGFLFFVLFAFAMNNQHEAQLKWFFGYEWRAPMVFIVLAVFGAGAVLGLLGHLPGWWRRLRARRAAATPSNDGPAAAKGVTAASTPAAGSAPTAPRDTAGPDTLLEPPRDVL